MIPRISLLLTFALVTAVMPGRQMAAQDQMPTFRSSADAIAVDATVRDTKRKSVTGLKAGDFEVFDNGVKQDVTEVSYGKLPIDVTVALDVSYSVNGLMLERLRRGVVMLMGDLAKDDRLKLMLFNSRVSRTVDFTNDEKKVEGAIKTAIAGGGTALFDTISVALVSTTPRDRRQLIVVFTDGNDSTSTTQPSILTNVALRTRAAVAMVMPGGAMVVTGPTNVQHVFSSMRMSLTPQPYAGYFQSLASVTGGSVVNINAASDFSTVFRQILEEFRSAYVLLYNAKGVDAKGYHALEVKVKRDGVTVFARRGYWN